MDIEFKVQKGDTFILEIEITKDIDLANEKNIIFKSLYHHDYEQRKIDDCFVINSLNFNKSLKDYRDKILEKISQFLESGIEF